MSNGNERKEQGGEQKKAELLPGGQKAKEIIEVLAAMYRAMESPEEIGDHQQGVKNGNH